MKLGISSYSLYQAMVKNDMSILDMIRWTAANGGEHVEIVALDTLNLLNNPDLAVQIRETAKECKIDLSNFAVSGNFVTDSREAFEQEVAKTMKYVDLANLMGIKLMRHDAASRPLSELSMKYFDQDLDQIVEGCSRVAEYAEQYDITTSIENHGFHLQSSDRVQLVVDRVNRSNFRTTLDVGNFLCVDENPVVAVKKNISYASMVHIKDFYVRPATQNPGEGFFQSSGGNYLRGAIAGQGDLDMWEILRIIKHSGYDGYISLEFEGMEECKQGVNIGMANIRRIWENV